MSWFLLYFLICPPLSLLFISTHYSDKVNLTKKENLLIFQSSLVPPQFKVVIGENTFDVAKGHNNLFHALVLFLLHIKSLEHGVLGRINLGLTGLNILNVLN